MRKFTKSKAKRKKAVEVAKDVLKQIKTKKIIAGHKGYFSLSDSSFEDEDKYNDIHFYGNELNTTNVKSILNGINKKCEVCAIGAVFVGFVDKYNKIDLKDVFTSYGCLDPRLAVSSLSSAFSEGELRTLERIYEDDWEGDCAYNENYEKITWNNLNIGYEYKLSSYHYYYNSDEKLLKYMMLNIIRNDGMFKLPKRIRKKKNA